ncbi:hypothetical protein V7149_01745 [Bacillus sp. JJ1503]|uniref:hypothetical protein n=1 Tax=Bacillus sp. JJ1503 TaxID=3122956 RepID=UPI002FFE0862
MKYFNTAGLIKGYIPDAAVIDGYTMFFIVEDQPALQLNISGSAVASQNCGVDRDKVFEWLWEEGNEIFLRESILSGTNITITSRDVINGQIITPFENLRKSEDMHL